MTFSWRQLEWYEEDERVVIHARDPYKRVDTLRSSRRVQVLVADELVVDSIRPLLLFETSLPTRYYLPFGDVHTVGSMSDIVDDKHHIRGTLDLSNAVWQRAEGSAELEGPHLEIAFVQDGYVAMRSSEHPVDDQTLLFTPSEWEAFVLGAKDGEFDVM